MPRQGAMRAVMEHDESLSMGRGHNGLQTLPKAKSPLLATTCAKLHLSPHHVQRLLQMAFALVRRRILVCRRILVYGIDHAKHRNNEPFNHNSESM